MGWLCAHLPKARSLVEGIKLMSSSGNQIHAYTNPEEIVNWAFINYSTTDASDIS